MNTSCTESRSHIGLSHTSGERQLGVPKYRHELNQFRSLHLSHARHDNPASLYNPLELGPDRRPCLYLVELHQSQDENLLAAAFEFMIPNETPQRD